MSNTTHDSPNPGRKRRRNRGGQNRNHHNSDGRQDDRGPRREGGGDRHREGGGNRNREGGDRGPRREGGGGNNRDRGQRERRAMPTPIKKLTFWQKLLKMIGLYKEPVRPARTERPERSDAPQKDRGQRNDDRGERPVKSNIRIARPQERKESERGPVESPRLYVGNLSYDVSESDLTELFKGIGGVRNVEIVYNRNTHRSKGYGFVEMLHVDDAKRSVEVLHDQPFMGRKLNVSGAKSKGQDEREDREDEQRQEPKSVRSTPRPAPITTPVVVAAAEVAAAESAPAEAAHAEITPAEVVAASPAPAAGETPAPVEEVIPAAVAEAPVHEAEVIPTGEAAAPAGHSDETKAEDKHEHA